MRRELLPTTLRDTDRTDVGRYEWDTLFRDEWTSRWIPTGKVAEHQDRDQCHLLVRYSNVSAALHKVSGRRTAPGPDEQFQTDLRMGSGACGVGRVRASPR